MKLSKPMEKALIDLYRIGHPVALMPCKTVTTEALISRNLVTDAAGGKMRLTAIGASLAEDLAEDQREAAMIANAEELAAAVAAAEAAERLADVPLVLYGGNVARNLIREAGYTMNEADAAIKQYADKVETGYRLGSYPDYVAWEIIKADDAARRDAEAPTPIADDVAAMTGDPVAWVRGLVTVDEKGFPHLEISPVEPDDFDRHVADMGSRATVGKLCKIKRSSAGHRAKWRKGR